VSETVLEVRDLTVRFGGVQAVDNVSFTLERGKILGVVGPNGAGKTTVFDAISGFVPATGHVVLEGKDISGSTPQARSRLRLGRSFQDARLFPSLTVRETLAIALERHLKAQGVVSTALSLPWVRSAERRVRARVEELIELMGLGAFRDKFVAELSTGSRRIVDLAVILAHDPVVLLLDEPSSGIAQRETEALGPLLHSIREQTGASLLVIEHDMPLIRGISDDLLALETGAVLMRGTPDEVLEDPRLVSAYLGTDAAVLERSGIRSEPAPASAPAPTGSMDGAARTRATPRTGSSSPGKNTVAPANGIAAKKAAAAPANKAVGAPRKKTAAAAPTKKNSAASAKKAAAAPAKRSTAVKKAVAAPAKSSIAVKKVAAKKVASPVKKSVAKKGAASTKKSIAKKATRRSTGS